jgi:hypothetical protein
MKILHLAQTTASSPLRTLATPAEASRSMPAGNREGRDQIISS